VRTRWENKPLGSLCSFVRGPFGGSLTKSCFVPSGFAVYEQQHAIYSQFKEVRYFINSEKFDEMRRFEVHPGDLIMSCSGTMGKVSILPDGIKRGIINQALLKLTPGPHILATFLRLWMESPGFQAELSKLSSGVAIKNVASVEVLKAIRIPLPPLEEQKRIVAILDEAFEGLDRAAANAKKNLANARELFDSHLSSTFEKVAEAQGARRLAEIVTRLTNGYVGPTRNIYLEAGVPYLLARHVRDNHLEFDGKTYVSRDFNEKHKKSKLKTGDVLLVQSGHIGHSAVVTPEHEGHNCHAMIVISPIASRLIGDFLSLYFCTKQMKLVFEEIRSGSTVPHLTCGLVRELMIPLPKTEDQWRLVLELKEFEQDCRRLASLATAKLAAINELRRSILQKAFAGEFTERMDLAA
jgi:type I restriction enzyme S subunit